MVEHPIVQSFTEEQASERRRRRGLSPSATPNLTPKCCVSRVDACIDYGNEKDIHPLCFYKEGDQIVRNKSGKGTGALKAPPPPLFPSSVHLQGGQRATRARDGAQANAEISAPKLVLNSIKIATINASEKAFWLQAHLNGFISGVPHFLNRERERAQTTHSIALCFGRLADFRRVWAQSIVLLLLHDVYSKCLHELAV